MTYHILKNIRRNRIPLYRTRITSFYLRGQGNNTPQKNPRVNYSRKAEEGNFLPEEGNFLPEEGNFLPEEGNFLPKGN